MFREMRRKKQVLSKLESEEVLEKGTAGVFAVHGDNGYPYAVPISYVYHDEKLYMHSAKSGHKIDAIMKDDKVSFTVIDKDEIIPKEFTTYFRSVICFGKARIIEDRDEKIESLKILTRKYSPNMEDEMNKEIEGALNHLEMIVIDIEHMSGKEAMELVKRKI